MTAVGDYEVGKGRPPKAYQFQPGVSGNPAGAKKGAKGVSAVIAEALARKVIVTEKGRRRRSISLLQAAVLQQANKAAAGDRHATKLILELLARSEDREEARAANAPLDPIAQAASDAVILEALRASAFNTTSEVNDAQVD